MFRVRFVLPPPHENITRVYNVLTMCGENLARSWATQIQVREHREETIFSGYPLLYAPFGLVGGLHEPLVAASRVRRLCDR